MAQYMTYGNFDKESPFEEIYQSGRMYVRAGVFLPDSDMDPRTGMLKPNNPRRGRVQAKSMEMQRLESEYSQLDKALEAHAKKRGIRIPAKIATLTAFAYLIAIMLFLLYQQGQLVEAQNLSKISRSRLESIVATNNALQAQIAEASDASTVCYAAARELNMIPSTSAKAIHLEAVDTRPLETMARNEHQQVLAEGQSPEENVSHAAATANDGAMSASNGV